MLKKCMGFGLFVAFFLMVANYQIAAKGPTAQGRAKLGDQILEISAENGRLSFQRVDDHGNSVGEPWFWPEVESSELRYEDPKLVEGRDGTWLVFREIGPQGVRSRAISLSDIFADGFESATTAAWDSTTPAVNLRLEVPAQVATSTPTIRAIFDTPTGIATAPETLAFQQDGAPITMSCAPSAEGADCAPVSPLADGPATLEAAIADVAGNVSPVASVSFTVDTVAPTVSLVSPAEGFLTAQNRILVSGSVSEPVTLQINGYPLAPSPDLTFSRNMPLAEGPNLIQIKATDAAGNETIANRSGVSDTLPPPPISSVLVTTNLGGATVSITGAAGAAEGGVTVRWRNTRTGQEVEVVAAMTGAFSAAIDGQEGDILVAVAIDWLDRESPPAHFPVDYLVPPDPTPFAPPLDPTVAYDLDEAIRFLHEGPNAVQKDVTPGAIEDRRVAWVRGKLKDRASNPIPGVKVQILDHPELGYTLTRTDGIFDIVVNGGGIVTFDFERPGYLPVQRHEELEWRDSTVLDDVVLIGLDPVATAISSDSTTGQVARSTPHDDGDGLREAVVFFPPGTTATMVLENGSTVPLPTLTVRASEYTVGEEGRSAMPGPLPENVAYTYAVELSADEAIAARAKRVEFSQPVFLYIDSFIPFPVGTPVPLAWYDREKAAWIPAKNGRVIEILAADSNGRAEIDIDGNGPASAERLAQLGFTDAEREQLAGLYQPGSQIWRSPIPHFTPWDTNFPYSPPDDATPPPEPEESPRNPSPDDDQQDDDGDPNNPDDPNHTDDESDKDPAEKTPDPDCVNGSVIECQNQIVRQQVEIQGTPYNLAYASYRTPGWGEGRKVTYPLRGALVPDSLEQIALKVNGLGIAEESFVAERAEFVDRPFFSKTVTLATGDAFGRRIQGAIRLRVSIGYTYPLQYRIPPDFEASWARFPEASTPGLEPQIGPRRRVTLWRTAQKSLDEILTNTAGTWDARVQKLGGFTLSTHHAYDPVGRTLHLGDGSQKNAKSLSPTLRTLAGSVTGGFSGDGGPALLAELNNPADLVTAPDGSLFFSDVQNLRIRAVRPDGTIETVAGNGEKCVTSGPSDDPDNPPVEGCDEGLAATSSRINRPAGIAFGGDKSWYFVDSQQNCIRQVDRHGILRTVAGICEPESGGGGGHRPRLGESGIATEMPLSSPTSIAVLPDGTFFIGDAVGLSQVTPDGILLRVADFFGQLTSIAIGRRGDLFLAMGEYGRIYRVSVDGVIDQLTGITDEALGLDGDPAANSLLTNLGALAFGPDDRIYFIEDGTRVRRIEEDGTLRTVAGPIPTGNDDGQNGSPESGNFLLENRFAYAAGIHFGDGGRLFISDAYRNKIFESQLAFPDYIEDELLIAQGNEVFVFDNKGRHLRTRHAVTGANLQTFEYNPEGLLTEIRDGNGNPTSIARDGSGNATEIVSAFGQVTQLKHDANGWLELVENPNLEKHEFKYSLGLMQERMDPRGNKKTYEYSGLGRLTATSDEEQNTRDFSLIDRNGREDRTTILSGSLGQRSFYTSRAYRDGTRYRSTLDAAGNFSTTETNRAGITWSKSRGVSSSVRMRPDPRLGESVAYTATSNIVMAPGLVSESSSAQDADLTNPADPWSFTTLSAVTSTNGRLTSATYTAEDRRLTTISPQGRSVSLNLDALARPIRFESPETEAWTAKYQATGELEELQIGSGVTARKTSFAYDDFHRLETIQDPEQRVVTFGYDDANRVTSTLLPDGKVVGFGYDSNGNVTAVTPPGRPAHVFSYTARNRLETYTLPDAGTGSAVESRVYDESKRLKEVHRPDGKVISFDYELAKDRLEKITSPRGETKFFYNPTNGLVAEIEEPDGQKVAFEYEGTLLKRTTWTGEVNGSVGRTYDNNFRVKTIDVNGEDPIEYVYDDDNLLIQVGEMTIIRDPESGREVSTQLGNVSTLRTYTVFGEPESYTARFGEAEIYYEHLTYNKLGWITDIERRQNGFHELLHYEYDDRGRLEKVWRDGSLESSYTYDDNSNRLSYIGPLGNATGTYDARDRVLTYGGASYTWTEAGELLTKTEGGETTTYDYDVFGNLRKVELPNGIIIEYLTDGAQRRIGKKVNGVLVKQWIYQDQLEPIAELDSSGNTSNRMVYGTRTHTPDLIRLSTGHQARILSDHLGSTRLVLNAESGELLQELRFDAFGRHVFSSAPQLQDAQFVGGLTDHQTGIVRFGARDYIPELGIWSSPDSIGFSSGSSNLYQYVHSSPGNYRDPDGRIPLPLITGLVGGVLGMGGNLLSQLGQEGPINWGNAFIAGGVGFAAGALAPATAAAGLWGAVALGAGANGLQYSLTQYFNNTPWSGGEFGLNMVVGGAAGALGGAFPVGPQRFNTSSPWMDRSLAWFLNEQEQLAQFFGMGSLGRSFGSSVLSNEDPRVWCANFF